MKLIMHTYHEIPEFLQALKNKMILLVNVTIYQAVKFNLFFDFTTSL